MGTANGNLLSKARVFTAVLLVLMILQIFSAEKVYAEELHYVRDNNIDFYLPDGWDVEEIAPEESSESEFEFISSSNGDGVVFDLYYHIGETSEPIYFDGGNGDAERYYEEQGRDLMERFYDEKYPGERVTVAEPELVDTTWDTYLKIRVTVESGEDQGEQLIYFSARNSIDYTYEDDSIETVDRILLFRNHQGGGMTADQLDEWAGPIAEEYYDFGYDDMLMGDMESSSFGDTYDSDGGTDMGAIFSNIVSILVPVIIVIVIFVAISAAKKRVRRGRSSYPKAGLQQMSLSPGTQGRRKAKRAEAEREKAKRTKGKRAKGSVERSRDIGSAVRREARGSGYISSLETLRKSGLVTREEMQELLDKYEKTMRDLENRKRRRN